MRSLVILAVLAAGAAAPALAQTVPDPDPYYGVPPAHHGAVVPQAVPAPPGTTWHAGPPMAGQVQMMAMPQGGRQMMMHRMGGHAQFQRIQRGGVVPQFWRSPRVQVRNWSRFGFPAPFAGGSWIRYYDDALLIDGNGRVFDSRPDWDWDRYGDAWGDDNGVPVFGQAYDDEDGPRGREWAGREHDGGMIREEREEHGAMREEREEHEGGMREDDRSDGRVRTRVFVTRGGPPPPPPPGYGGYGRYGYGYGAGGVVVTETTVTEPPVVESRTYVRYETVRVRVAHRRHHRCAPCACSCRVSHPAPVQGERG
jgi:Ni/Co efflux regulator RcnB